MSTILLVDDNPADRALFRVLLGRAGYVVAELAHGRRAVDEAKALMPHLVVLDLNLADADGHEICRKLKADPVTARTPVLMLTVVNSHEDVVAGLEAGADDYVGKDEPHQVILARIQRLTRYRQMMESAQLNQQLAQVGRLLTGIVHEIRGPLSVVRGHAELLQVLLKDDPVTLEWVEPIVRSAKLLQLRLTHLMAAVRAGSTRPEEARLLDLVKEAVDLFGKGLDPRGSRPIVKIEAEAFPDVLVDAGKFLLVLLNLLNNAVEAMQASQKPDGVIKVRVTTEELDDRPGSRIEVVDDGPGIPSNLLDRIFEPFFSTKPNGTGYGLHLSSEIVQGMGGRMTAKNRPEGGACIGIWIPLEPAAVPALVR